MRSIVALIATVAVAGTGLAACTMSAAPAPAPMRTFDSQRQIDMMLGGRVPQRPISCLPNGNENDMKVIDANTLAYRYGSTVYVARTSGCTNLSPNGMYALLTHHYGGTGLCRGDVAQVVEPGSAVPVGSCMIEDITPFVPARR